MEGEHTAEYIPTEDRENIAARKIPVEKEYTAKIEVVADSELKEGGCIANTESALPRARRGEEMTTEKPLLLSTYTAEREYES